MQLILDADNIDIERNMSTSEQESFNEKLITNKVIEHLADDITSGNKENIEKQINIISDIGPENAIDTDKEIQVSGDDTLTINSNVEKIKEDINATKAVESSKIVEEEDVKTTSEQLFNDSINETVNNEESQIVDDEVSLAEVKDINETDLIVNNSVEEDIVTVKELVDTQLASELKNDENLPEKVNAPELLSESNEENNIKLDNSEKYPDLIKENDVESGTKVNILEILPESNQENVSKVDKNVNIDEILTENNERNNEGNDNTTLVKNVNTLEKPNDSDKENIDEVENTTNDLEIPKKEEEGNEIEQDKEVDISELSNELNEEAAMDLDKEIEEAEVSSESNSDNIIEIDESIPVRDDELQTESEIKNQDAKIDVDVIDNDKKVDSQEAEQKNDPIEIDDEDEKKEDRINEETKSIQDNSTAKKAQEELTQPKRICRLSNNLDIFSDEEEDDHSNKELPEETARTSTEKQCIDVDYDDDIMLIDEESSTKDSKTKEINDNIETDSGGDNIDPVSKNTSQQNIEINSYVESEQNMETNEETLPEEKDNKESIEPAKQPSDESIAEANKVPVEKSEVKEKSTKPLLPKNFVKTCKKNLADMTRDDLEEFCILKIVESIVDRSNLGEIKTQLKNLTQTMEECKKKCLMLTKQNKDLQIVLKSVQEEQKNGSDLHITPLKITRSVGMQVMMVADKNIQRKKSVNGSLPIPTVNPKHVKPQQLQNTRNQKEKTVSNQQIPVPRLVPATPPAAKVNQTTTNNTPPKQANNNSGLQNGLRVQPPTSKAPEKRNRAQAVTVDLTDDEPPAKLANTQRAPINTQMRVITTAPNIIPTPRFAQNMNSPRKVYIPISGPQAQNVRPGQTIMLKSLSSLGPRPRAQAPTQVMKSSQTSSPVRYRAQSNRHPAPLPDATRQLQPPNWKSLPPAPDLKLSKVENGIVISWKIDGYQEENHEEIASYQLYAYQETSSPPNTTLWKKIGDVKALPLPMACTLTQFMAGYKYYFAVRAVDVKSRFGPFSLPGSILLLNKI